MEPDEEGGDALHDADLEVGEEEQLAVDESIILGVSRRTFHDVRLGGFIREGDGGEHVGSKVDEKDEDGVERQRYLQCQEGEEGTHFRDVGGEGVRDRLLQVVEDESSLLDSLYDGREVVVDENHVRRLLGNG